MTAIRWILSLALAGFLGFFGVAKFTGAAHIFPYIEMKAVEAGVAFADYAYPYANYATGALELLAALLLLLPFTRPLGCRVAILPFLGAVVFHLSPFLGVVTPDGYSSEMSAAAITAGGPITRGDFTVSESPGLFIIACAGLLASVINLFVSGRRRAA